MNARLGFAVLALLAVGAGAVAAENDLPRRKPGETLPGAAELFRNEPGDVLPGKELPIFELPDEPAIDVARAKAELDRTQRKEQRWQKLFKSGVLARVEAEACVLATARARTKYEQARVADQRRSLEELRKRVAAGQLSAETVSAAESALRTAEEMSAQADASFRRTQLLLAQTNVERQRRLLSLGAGSKTQLKRAESALLQLKPPGAESGR